MKLVSYFEVVQDVFHMSCMKPNTLWVGWSRLLTRGDERSVLGVFLGLCTRECCSLEVEVLLYI